MHSSITEKTEFSSSEKIIIFGCHQHRNGYECPDILYSSLLYRYDREEWSST